MLCSDVEEGGETIFPQAGGKGARAMCGGRQQKGLSVRPKKGNAVIFWSATTEGKEDPMSEHGSCAVVKGTKWSATKWIRTGR